MGVLVGREVGVLLGRGVGVDVGFGVTDGGVGVYVGITDSCIDSWICSAKLVGGVPFEWACRF